MHVIMVGARPEAIEALLAGGHTVTVLHENTTKNQERIAPYRDRLRYTCVVDAYSKVESLWSAVHHTGASAERVDAVIPLFEPAVVPAALLAALLGARALDPVTALRCRDKALQKGAWARAGVRTARHLVTTGERTDLAVLTAADGLQAPFVVKPIAGFGTMHTFVVDDADRLDRAVAKLTGEHPELGRLLIEERNSGDEWIIDGMVSGGQISWVMISRYMSPMIECTEANPLRLLALSPALHPDIYQQAREFAQRAVAALGLRDSTFHFEVFGTPEDFVAGELAARPGGAMQPAQMRRMLGVDVWECTVKAVTGDPVTPPRAAPELVLGYAGLPITPGKTNQVTEADLLSIPGVVEVCMDIPTGKPMPEYRAHSGVQVAGVRAEGRDDEECCAILASAIDAVRKINGA